MTTTLIVTGAEMVSPATRRVWFRSDDLSAFEGSEDTDRYVKLVFVKPGVVLPEPLDLRALHGVMDPADIPDVRTYTALFPDVAAGTLAIDFVLHAEGVAGNWATSAAPGDVLLANGPGGGYRPDPEADWHLLVADETALPAVEAALAAMPGDAVVELVVVVDGPGCLPNLPELVGLNVTEVHRDPNTAEANLVDAVRALEWREGRVQAFVHGEAAEVMHGVRPYLIKERGLDRRQVSVSGYWRRGIDEGGFRVWKQELAAKEA